MGWTAGLQKFELPTAADRTFLPAWLTYLYAHDAVCLALQGETQLPAAGVERADKNIIILPVSSYPAIDQGIANCMP